MSQKYSKESVVSVATDIIRRHLGERAANLVANRDDRDKLNLVDNLGADSLDVVYLVMDIEEELGITIPEEECDSIKTFGDLVKRAYSLLEKEKG